VRTAPLLLGPRRAGTRTNPRSGAHPLPREPRYRVTKRGSCIDYRHGQPSAEEAVELSEEQKQKKFADDITKRCVQIVANVNRFSGRSFYRENPNESLGPAVSRWGLFLWETGNVRFLLSLRRWT
jgi:hypothetical protein